MPIVCLVPLWGLLALVMLEIRTRGRQDVYEEVSIEKLKINDAIHRSILMEEDPIEDRVVPLGEALLINDPLTRRELMMEVMYANPDDYVQQLKEARTNDDTEVVHYAVTALAELQKEYDLQFQELDWKMKNDPDDDEIIDSYLKLLDQYLQSGIAEGNDRMLKLRSYSSMLERKINRHPDRLSLWREKAAADLKTGAYDEARQGIEHILQQWDRNEAGYLLMIQYYSAVQDRRGIEQILQMVTRKNIYLTPEGRGQIRFWQEERGSDI